MPTRRIIDTLDVNPYTFDADAESAERRHIETFAEGSDEAVRLAHAAVDAFKRVARNRCIDDDALAVFAQAIRSLDTAALSLAGKYLIAVRGLYTNDREGNRLAVAWDDTLLGLVNDPKADVRVNTLCIVAKHITRLGEPTALYVIGIGLKDRSYHVRLAAIDAALAGGWAASVPVLEAMRESETHAKVIERLDWCLTLLKGGAIIDNGYETTRAPGGGVRTRYVGDDVG